MSLENEAKHNNIIQRRKNRLQFIYGCALSVAVLFILESFVKGAISEEMGLFTIIVLHFLHEVLRIVSIPLAFLAMYWWVYRIHPKYSVKEKFI